MRCAPRGFRPAMSKIWFLGNSLNITNTPVIQTPLGNSRSSETSDTLMRFAYEEFRRDCNVSYKELELAYKRRRLDAPTD